MPFVTDVLKDTSFSASARQQALNRIFSDPGLPQTSTTSSFWTQEKYNFSQGAAMSLPKEADVVIIGSGITGASIARTLLQSRASNPSSTSHPSVVMLEARTVCSGATGRNGGHILETADEYAEFADAFGVDAARKLVRFRLAHLREILAVAEELGITTETQARKVQFLSVYFGEEPWRAAMERMRRFKEGMPEEAAEWTSYEGDAIPRELCLTRARGVVAGPAGALWPYRFVTGVLKRLLADFPDDLRVEENTPVTAVYDETSSSGPRYKIETSRGTITARHVIHCTNAHVSHLVPGFRGRIFPVRGQMSAQTPGDKFPNQATNHSWLFNYDRGFDYMTQLPEGQMMLGGGFAQSEAGGLAEMGVSTDSDLSLYIDIHLSGALRAIFGGTDWGCVQGDPVQAMWTGNMAFSSDGFPWVGRLSETATGRSEHGSEGAEWVCAAFGGEGMVQAWFSGKAVATMLLAQDASLSETVSADLSWFPEQLLMTEERFADAVLPKEAVDDVHKANL
ncbi:FAD dependent oxidoreductase [Penicillium robsamsonii]|uniref:FAD dependent oxidoreductase n=1 Tax=Penicillium robsamsonii TaxID=1792511 RepID=UPI00254820DC|nr:FAD dependent oxidoreductase [Penicillium robsamsonii]KAJ5824140.1 FAD dependent oxidoreductase [Penicillium robsamsonii]